MLRKLRPFLTALALCAGGLQSVPIAASAELTSAPSFAGIAWGASRSDVINGMTAAGFSYDPQHEKQSVNKVQEYSGRVQGVYSTIYENFTPEGKLVATQVNLFTAANVARDTYYAVQKSLVDKYGAPTITKTFDFRNDEATFEAAVKAKKGQLSAEWDGPESTTYFMREMVDDDLSVMIWYSSEGWAAEDQRRGLSVKDSHL